MHAPLHVKTHASMYARAISSKSRCVNDYYLSSPVSGKLFYDDPAIDRIDCGGGDVWMCSYVRTPQEPLWTPVAQISTGSRCYAATFNRGHGYRLLRMAIKHFKYYI